MQPPLLLPQGPPPISWVPFQVHGHVVGEVGAALTRLMPHKNLCVPQCRNRERGFLKCNYPHAVKLMDSITAVSPFFVFEHEKCFYSVNSKCILQLAGRFQAYQDKFQLQSTIWYSRLKWEKYDIIYQAITSPLSNNHRRTLTPRSSLIEQEYLSGTRF